ncbi:MAG: OmcA/MtrC family decaheme c-type cytochrome [Betaproteobacteria bacterium]|nr:OmcA/MtrC family decaheme c-type cytochrome [Betaproteobacteria bacterium]
MRLVLVRLGLAAVAIGALAACSGGGGGGDGVAAGGGAAGAAAPVVAAPTGAAPVVLTAATPAATFAALTPAVPAVSVTVASPPVVTFSLTDGNGNPIIGFGSKSQSATATVAQYPNLAFALAKLVPGTGTAPSRWVSYIVNTVPTRNATTGAITASVPSRPSTDNTGTLVDNGNGTYTYTFFRDITAVKAQVAAATLTGANVAADLDDLTFEPNLVHRLTIQISGNAPGTGSNTPNGVTVTPGVPMANPVNVIYDFIPATGQQVTDSGRDIAATAKCNECHQNLGGFPDASEAASDATFHGGNRNDVRYCAVCHTEQRKYGRTEAVVDAAGNYDGASTYRTNGLAVGNLRQHIHKIHFSKELTKTGYNYAGLILEEACKFPQDLRNCTKCHDGSATSTARTAQGDNWMTRPSRAACGSCHDGINFITGAGITLADAQRVRDGLPREDFAGHIGGARADDSLCALCHDAAVIPVYHLPVTRANPTNALLAGGTNSNTNAASIASNRDRLPDGAIKVSYEIQSVSLNPTRNPVMVFRLLQDGQRKDLNDFATTADSPATGSKEIWDNFMGAPSVYFVYAVPQDGIAAPADFNASASVYLRSLWNGTASGASAGTLTGPDANGFYTATITGSTVPTNAVMLTGGLGFSYNVRSSLPLTQTNVAGYPTAPATGTGLTAGMPNATGGLIVIASTVQRVASGFLGRRVIVEDARCNRCHLELGVFTHESFHGGQRNDATTCSWCHNPNRTSRGWSADSTSFVHAIHAAAKRNATMPFTWHAASPTDGFFTIGYPGILNNCETCHLPGTYDYSATGSAIPSPNNRQYRAVATGTLSSTSATAFEFAPATLVPRDVNFGAGFAVDANGAPTAASTTVANGTNLVTSPIATVCFACHTDDLAIAHMRSNGGSLYVDRTTALTTTEQCTLCHLTGRVADIKVVHAR